MLLLTSNSYKGVFLSIKNRRVLTCKFLDKQFIDDVCSEDEILAIGGGMIIDAAKCLSTSVVACPTTAAGSASTSHAVYWSDGRKYSKKATKPKAVFILEDLIESVPGEVMIPSAYDALGHCFDSHRSTKKNEQSEQLVDKALHILFAAKNNLDYVRAGNIAGEAIEITGTNLSHCLSYAMTGIYGIPHGVALQHIIPRLAKEYRFKLPDINQGHVLSGINWKLVVDDAFSYDRVKEFDEAIDKVRIVKVMSL